MQRLILYAQAHIRRFAKELFHEGGYLTRIDPTMFVPRLIAALSSIHISSAAVLRPTQPLAQENSLFILALSAEVLNNETTNVTLSDIAHTSTPDPWTTAFLLPTILKAPNAYRYVCNGSLFGRDFNPRSCLDAWSHIPAIGTELSFGPRRREASDPYYDVFLPKRFLSCRFWHWQSRSTEKLKF